MRILPSSTITLYSGVDIDNGEQLVFSSKNNQTAYFQSKITRQAVPCQMVRKTGALRIEAPGNIVAQCNYLSFINPDFDNKIVYARIVDYDYVNNECVEVAYAIDYWQTWMFDVSFQDMYIEREHLSEEDWDKAEQNPYDPTIYEFRTSETLPISKDLEKVEYDISGQSGSDGLKLAMASHSLTTSTNTLGVLIKMANINLKSIDDTYIAESGWTPAPGAYVNLPTYAFFDYLNKIINQTFGFFYITTAMYNYYVSRYPSGTFANITSRREVGSGWTSAGIMPFQESAFEPPLCYIYDAFGASNSAIAATQSHMGEFFDITTRWSGDGLDNLIVDLSIIPNDMITFAGTMSQGGVPFSAGVQPAQTSVVVNKKLMRYPFCYVRVISPNGDIKELQYEKFEEMRNGNGTAYVFVTMDLSDQPTIIVAPAKYKVTGMSQASNVDTNIEEALYFKQFPTLPYNIDAFTAQVAAVANDTIANSTEQNAAHMAGLDVSTDLTTQESKKLALAFDSMLTASKGLSSGVVGGIVGSGRAAAQIEQMYTMSGQLAMDRKEYELQAERWQDAMSALTEQDGGAIGRQLRLTKAAYAVDRYHPSNGVGATNFNYLSYCDIILMNVSLNADVLAVYDKYFTCYGYNSGRNGIPHVISYMQGSSATSEVPHWLSLNGHDTTYIKTMDCKVTHSMIPVAGYIKSMFDGGIRMIKGD